MLATANKLDERQIRATTLVHFRRLERYWAKNPPEHIIGRAFITLKEAEPGTSDLAGLLGMAPTGTLNARALRGG